MIKTFSFSPRFPPCAGLERWLRDREPQGTWLTTERGTAWDPFLPEPHGYRTQNNLYTYLVVKEQPRHALYAGQLAGPEPRLRIQLLASWSSTS